MVALAIKILGRPGTDKDANIQDASLIKIESNFKDLIGKINSIEEKELPEFLSFNVLNEIIDKPSGIQFTDVVFNLGERLGDGVKAKGKTYVYQILKIMLLLCMKIMAIHINLKSPISYRLI